MEQPIVVLFPQLHQWLEEDFGSIPGACLIAIQRYLERAAIWTSVIELFSHTFNVFFLYP